MLKMAWVGCLTGQHGVRTVRLKQAKQTKCERN